MAPAAASSDVADPAFPRSLPGGRSGFHSSTEIVYGAIDNSKDVAVEESAQSFPGPSKCPGKQ